MVIRALAVALLASGCVQSDLVACSDGRLCPAGTTCDEVNASCIAEGGIGIAPGDIDLGTLACGARHTHAVVVTNPSSSPIDVHAHTTSAAVSVEPVDTTIPPRGMVELSVAVDLISASVPGEEAADVLVVETSAGRRETRVVRYGATGAVITAGGTLDFGETGVSAVTTRAFTVRNSGNAAAELALGALSGPFSAPTHTVTLGPNSQVDVSVTFAAGGVISSYDQTLGLTFSGVQCQPPPDHVALSARSSGDPILASATQVDFGVSGCGVGSLSQNIVLTNQLPVDQDVTATFTSATDLTVTSAGTLPAGPDGHLALTVTRPALAPPRSVGTTSATLQVKVEPAGVTKQIGVIYTVNGAILSIAPFDSGLPSTGDYVEATISNAGNVLATVKPNPAVISEGAGGQSLSVLSDSLLLGPSQSGFVQIKYEEGSNAIPSPNKFGGPFSFDAMGACSRPPQLWIVGDPSLLPF